ncbi:MAG: PEGA domain-containing protein [Deltaproteobacteria bacterium]|nr:PEGA domain-containing protein [Deltaproteobacteria bacterium]
MARLRKTPAVETDPGKSGSGSAPKVPPKRRPKPKPKGKGLLKLNSKPWGRVWIDGKDIGRPTPLINYELPAGKHRVTIHFQNGTSKTVVVDIKPDETTKSIVEAD